ncbi:membrane protein of unknown function [Tenacibaculum jejuense]|uniref:Uncharacterized protein n=2 Tax=Tenacibaculum jejuense TaxID=584609 RepID=A0A238U5Y5_9FLAO|nr:membrane protein of unknown function [Tenacibaculum jejuense]
MTEGRKRRNKVMISLIRIIIFTSVIAPYIHIFLSKKDTVNVFGFNNLRTFLFVIGLPISLFTCANVLLYITKFMEKNSPKIQVRIIAILFLWSSFFQFIWIFWDRQDLPKPLYYISIVVLSFVSTVTFNSFIHTRESTRVRLQKAVNAFSTFSFITAKKHIKTENIEAYEKELLSGLHDEIN